MRAKLELGRGRQTAPKPPGGIRPALFYMTFAALLATNVATGIGLVMTPDIAGLLNGQNEMVLGAYEDRIAQLRIEVDRLHSRQYAQAGDVNLQLQDLSQQQELLIEQHQYVKSLIDTAADLGLTTAAVDPAAPAPLDISSIAFPVAGDLSSIEQATDSVSLMMEESQFALSSIASTATGETNEIVSELSSLGIAIELPEAGEAAVGGPFMPAVDGADSVSLVDDANAVMAALVRFKAARSAIDFAPIHMPLSGDVALSSTYGNRTDPFTGKKAFHAGLDFPAASGTLVLSAGAGTVVFVGQRSGYGNVVEIEHESGLITRYGHLSAFLVDNGQVVDTGMPIAKVGSTGRSTGPHLHFEVRRANEPINPADFLKAGKRLEKFFAAV